MLSEAKRLALREARPFASLRVTVATIFATDQIKPIHTCQVYGRSREDKLWRFFWEEVGQVGPLRLQQIVGQRPRDLRIRDRPIR